MIRKLSLYIAESSYFDKFILSVILFDSVLMALHDHSNAEKERNELFADIGKIFSFLYLLEFVIKSVAYGLFMN